MGQEKRKRGDFYAARVRREDSFSCPRPPRQPKKEKCLFPIKGEANGKKTTKSIRKEKQRFLTLIKGKEEHFSFLLLDEKREKTGGRRGKVFNAP